eukprot:g13086.t1
MVRAQGVPAVQRSKLQPTPRQDYLLKSETCVEVVAVNSTDDVAIELQVVVFMLLRRLRRLEAAGFSEAQHDSRWGRKVSRQENERSSSSCPTTSRSRSTSRSTTSTSSRGSSGSAASFRPGQDLISGLDVAVRSPGREEFGGGSADDLGLSKMLVEELFPHLLCDEVQAALGGMDGTLSPATAGLSVNVFHSGLDHGVAGDNPNAFGLSPKQLAQVDAAAHLSTINDDNNDDNDHHHHQDLHHHHYGSDDDDDDDDDDHDRHFHHHYDSDDDSDNDEDDGNDHHDLENAKLLRSTRQELFTGIIGPALDEEELKQGWNLFPELELDFVP